MKTDPANSDYTMERGGTRNYEPWRDKERTVAEAIAAREEEEKGNAMKVGSARAHAAMPYSASSVFATWNQGFQASGSEVCKTCSLKQHAM